MSSASIVHEVTWIATNVYNHRSSWPFVFFIPFLGLSLLLRKQTSDAGIVQYGRGLVIAAIAFLFGLILVSHILYTTSNHFTNVYATDYADEAWTFAQGQDLYSSLQSSFRYNLCYGPGGYLLVAASQAALGPSPFSSCLPIFCCWLGGFMFLYFALRKRHGWPLCLAVATLGMAILPHLQEFEFWPRPDFPQFFFVMAGIWVVARDLRFSWIVLGLLIGITVSIKINGFAYFLPLIASLLFRRFELVNILIAFLVSILISFLPFFIFGNISLATYAELIQMTLHHTLDINLAYNIFEMSVVFSILAFAPLMIFRVEPSVLWALLKKNGPYIIGLSVGLLIILSVAVKKGAGDHHFIPFIGPIFYLGASLYADLKDHKRSPSSFSPAGASLFFSECAVIYGYAVYFSLATLSHIGSQSHTVRIHEDDLDQMIEHYPDKAILFTAGAINGFDTSTYRSYLVFRGNPVGIDPATFMDYTEAHIPQTMPEAVAAEIAYKFHRQTIWITPRGDAPFTEETFFSPWGPNYSPEFLQHFHQHFKLIDQSAYFDIYGETRS